MSEIDYITAWQRADPKHVADAKAFWSELDLIPPQVAEERASELCALAYRDGRLVGLTTVQFKEFRTLRANFAFFRCAVHPDLRRHYLATFLTRQTLTIMEGWSLENPQAKIQGIAAIFEAWELSSKAVYPQWADWNIHLNLVAHTNAGDQVRVAWFRHAKLEASVEPAAPRSG